MYINSQLLQEMVAMLQTLRNLNGLYDEDKDAWKVDAVNKEADELLKRIGQVDHGKQISLVDVP